jgi:hypothetical protein
MAGRYSGWHPEHGAPGGVPGRRKECLKILIAADHMLSTGRPYHDLGAAYLDRVEKRRTTRNLLRRLERLGYEVTSQPKAA